jgi:hypothetical protein
MRTIFTKFVRPHETRNIDPPKIEPAKQGDEEQKTVVLQWGGGAEVKVFQNQFTASVSLYMEKQQREQEQNLNQ